ncbi:MAG: metallophosphoesterase [Myxococcales bacterium]|nr:metallophosphoesterase [Myxococcales bacterium]
MTAIDIKYKQLKDRGFDLGSARGPEQDAHSGGRMRAYLRGTIFWHQSTGAHALHGALLQAYEAIGGPGPDPKSGERLLGYPSEDARRTPDNRFAYGVFEWGSITVLDDHQGIVVRGDRFKLWERLGGALGALGHPIAPELAVAGGRASFFERGCVYEGPASGGLAVASTLDLPPLGQPDVAAPSGAKLRIADAIRLLIPVRFRGSAAALKRAIAEVWSGRLGLRPTATPTAAPLPLRLLKEKESEEPSGGWIVGPIARDFLPKRVMWPLGVGQDLADRTLYDVVFLPPAGAPTTLAPHALYAKGSWSACGLMHISDLHVSRRLEGFRGRLVAPGRDAYVNYNDGVRTLIHRANQLHREGKLDAILATGDLVDYIYEHDDHPGGAGNWGFLQRLLCGQAPAEGESGEALAVPIFFSGGNHDYRKHPYELLFDIDVRLWPDPTVRNYSSHNLTEAEAKRIQGGKKLKVDQGGAVKMVEVDQRNPHYLQRMVRAPSYIVRLGKHRIVMIDSRWDAGVLTGTWDAIKTKAGFGSSDERNFAAGHPNSEGFTPGDVALVKKALAEAAGGGAVIVGVHAPPINTAGNEYAHFFRETARAKADLEEIRAFLRRQAGWVGAVMVNNIWSYPKGWLHRGEAYFRIGSRKGIDYGVARGKTDDFVAACVGVGAPRAVDIVLSGHVHKTVEYRVARGGDGKLRYYTDFYTETPTTYYTSRVGGKKVYINVRPGAPLDAKPAPSRDHVHNYADCLVLDVPPYADPLEASAKPKAWWQRHRPLMVQTASIGPLDAYQRLDDERTRPQPSFRGARLLTIAGDVITRVDYLTIAELEGAPAPRPRPTTPPGGTGGAPRPTTRVPARRGGG